MGYSAFEGCSALTSITLPFIGEKENGAKKFEHIFGTVPQSLTTVEIRRGTIIGEWAFQNSPSLKNIILPQGIADIGNYAFLGCTNLETITIPGSVKKIGQGVFADCNLKEVLYQGDETDWCNIVFEESSSNPLRLNSCGLYIRGNLVNEFIIPADITKINDYAFFGYKGLTSLTISDSVREIGRGAFSDCDSLKSVTVPDGVTKIGWGAFACASLQTITLPFIGLSPDGNGSIKFGEIFNNVYYTYPTKLETVKIMGGVIEENAFGQCSTIKEVWLPENLTVIGQHAFDKCTSLTFVSLPESLTTIEEQVFLGCISLNNVILPDRLKNIGEGAFSGCQSLESINLPDSLTTIGEWAFYDCTALTDVVIPDDIVSVGNYAFSGCQGLLSMSLPISVTFSSLFNMEQPASLKTLTVTGATVITDYALGGCKYVTDIIIPDNVTSIGIGAFSGCVSLVNINMPSALTSIGDWAFQDCSELSGLSIPDGVTNIGRDAFAGCKSLLQRSLGFEYVDKWLVNCYSEGNPGDIRADTVGIAGCAFYKRTGLTAVTVPESVRYIGKEAFFECFSLTSLTLPFIGGDATGSTPLSYIFGTSVSRLSPLTALTVTGGIMCDNALDYTAGIETLVIGGGVAQIGFSALKKCTGLTSLTLPFIGSTMDGLENTWFGYIFGADTALKNPEFVPDALKEIVITGGDAVAEGAFRGCNKLLKVSIPNSMTKIGDYAFYECANLDLVEIGNSVEKIGQFAFFGCRTIKSIYIPNSVDFIDNSAFENCNLLTEIKLDYNASKLYSIGSSSFRGCTALLSVSFPKGFSGIGSSAFEGCTKLSDVKFSGDGLINLSAFAFRGCISLTEMSLPFGNKSSRSVHIGKGAFAGCDNIESLKIPFVGYSKDGASNTHFGYIFGAEYYNENGDYVPAALKRITVNEGSIGAFAFYGCNGLISITLGSEVSSIGERAFVDCKKLVEIYDLSSKIKIEKGSTTNGFLGYYALDVYNSESEASKLSVKDEFLIRTDGTEQTAVEYYGSATTLIVPSQITRINRFAFAGCQSLQDVHIYTNMVSIGESAFADCNSLSRIHVPFIGESSESVENTYFGYIFGAKHYSENNDYIPQSLKSVRVGGGNRIPERAFHGCRNISSVEIYSSYLTSIADYAFYYCTGLIELSLPDSVTTIGYSSFNNCTSLISFRIPTNIKTIGDSAFEGCVKLVEIFNRSNLVVTKGSAENGHVGCYAKIIHTIPNAASKLTTTENGYIFFDDNGAYYLMGYSGTETVLSLPSSFNGNLYLLYQGAFMDKTAITEVHISDSIVQIGADAFSGCTALTKVNIGSGVSEISANAFKNCTALTNIIIPENVSRLGSQVFYGCTALTDIWCEAANMQLGWHTDFKGNSAAAVHWGGSWEYVDGIPAVIAA